MDDAADATVELVGPNAKVCLVRHMSEPPSVVWRDLTDQEHLKKWFPSDVAIDGGTWTVGANITFTFSPDVIDMTLTGRVLTAKEPEELAFNWGDESLRFKLSPDGDGTHFVLIDTLAKAHAARNAAGWEVCLDRLEGVASPDDKWPKRFADTRTNFWHSSVHKKVRPSVTKVAMLRQTTPSKPSFGRFASKEQRMFHLAGKFAPNR